MSKMNFAEAVKQITAHLPSGEVTVAMKFHVSRKIGKADRDGLTYTAIHNQGGTRVYTAPTLEALVEKVAQRAGPPFDAPASKLLKEASDAAGLKAEEEVKAKLAEAAEKKAK